MLTVDAEKRATVEECLEHPWITQQTLDPTTSIDSTDGLPAALQGLDFSKRKAARERTLLSSLNSVRVSAVGNDASVKVWDKQPVRGDNANGRAKKDPKKGAHAEETPHAQRAEQEFMEMGGKG